MTAATRRLTLDRPVDVHATFIQYRRGPHDPTFRLVGRELWRATRTAEGPCAVYLVADGATIEAQAWGPGRNWALENLPRFVGAADDLGGFAPLDPVVADLARRFEGMRIGRTDAVIEALVPAIIEQKITSHEAHRAFRHMVKAWGEPAPGPTPLYVPPDPARLASTPYYGFHRFGIERKRADVIKKVCARATRLEECAMLDARAAETRLRSFTGIGVWTAAEVAARAFGDPDAVSLNDFHLPHLVSWALAREPRGTDDRMLKLLAPYAGQRGRVIRLIELGTARLPRRVPRRRVRSIARI